MSEDKYHNTHKTRYESLSDLNLLVLWSESGSDWSLTIKEEIQATTNQPIEEGEPNATDKVVLFGVLTALALLSAATWMQAPKIYHAMQQAGKNSVEQLIHRYY
jgi:hypothetical protein